MNQVESRFSARNLFAGCAAAMRRFLCLPFRIPGRALKRIFAPPQPNQSRRDLLHGRLWKLFPSPTPPPLVMRYPLPDQAAPSDAKPRSISGISIDLVPATNLGLKSVSRTLPVFRPPGAIDELQFLAGCTRCGDCIAACPYQAIHPAPPRLGSLSGTPIIEADTAACWMCPDFPCIAACPEKVLVNDIPPIMGTARIVEHLCLAHHHTTCSVCSERCPVNGAIAVADGKPVVNEESCTGCGVCRHVCPAPENAILLMPAFSRPGLPRT